MTEIILFHHAQGLTSGCLAFAEDLRAAGHVVHTPDCYEGKTFGDLDSGVAHAKQIGFSTILERGVLAAQSRPADVVYAGFSLGVMAAQKLAQTRPGAKGALFLHSTFPPEEFDAPWPSGLPVQIHTMEADDWGDVDVAREFAATVDTAELFLYPGDAHLFTDSSLPAYDEPAATLVKQRILAFLSTLE